MPPPSPSYTVSAEFVENLVWAAEQEGLEVENWKQSLAREHATDTRLPFSLFQSLWDGLLRQACDPLLGLRLGRHLRLGRWGLVEYFLLNARTLGDALQLAAAYWRLVADEDKDIRLDADGNGLKLTIWPRIAHPPATFEVDLSYAVKLVGLMLGQPVGTLAVGFAHPLPDGAKLGDYASHFGCQVSFDEACYWLRVPRSMAAAELPTAHPLVMETLRTQVDLQLKMLDRPTNLAARVSQLIEFGASDVGQVAAQLGMSTRSLQRRLKEDGQAFALLKDGALRRRAQRLLGEARMPLKEVAFFLGYEERGLFQACMRWFGQPPGAVRAQFSAA
jgi:AraC-like DNA-binding protein